ncbi:MAG: chorismate-binding protein [Alphaproteobacteria bacterium GM7ARS4]|nr:chorismate-binding protein [Alphaproteobacteria bacterium GM7ARS4]
MLRAPSSCYEEFASRWQDKGCAIVWRTLCSDTLTPVAALMRLGKDKAWTFLLESASHGGTERGRYSAIGIDPDRVWRCSGNRAVLWDFTDATPRLVPQGDDALASLRRFIEESQMDIPDGMPSILAGVFGYMGYDMAHLMERIRREDTHPQDNGLGIDDSLLMRPQRMLVFDWVEGVLFIAFLCWRRAHQTAESARLVWERANSAIDETISVVNAGQNAGQGDDAMFMVKDLKDVGGHAMETLFSNVASNMTREAFCEKVDHVKDYIHAGDIFQLVLSQRFSIDYHGTAFAFYRALRRLNPSPFLFYFHFDDMAVVGASPELLVRLHRSVVTIRPVAGTRPRGANVAEDERLRRELEHDPKECAEHLMLLDLGRNDVGRVAEGGSVSVTERMVVEKYSHVMHIVSNVEGRCLPHCHALDVLMAGFPAGTLSGAPKIRAMEIIDMMEPCMRGLYGGGVGYFSANGDLDSCIALRTAIIKDGKLYIQAGGGIVADSLAPNEYEETRNKARALLHAARESVLFEEP